MTFKFSYYLALTCAFGYLLGVLVLIKIPFLPYSVIDVISIACPLFVIFSRHKPYSHSYYLSIILLILLFFCYFFSTVINIGDIDTTLIYLAKLGVNFFFLLFFINALRGEESLEPVCKAIVAGALIAALLIVFNISDIAIYQDGKRVTFGGGIGINTIAIYLGFSLVVCISLVQSSSHLVQKLIYISVCLVITLCLLRLGTRSSVWGVFVAFVFAYMLSHKINWKFIFSVMGILFILNRAFFSLIEYFGIPIGVAERLLDVGAIQENSRLELWSIAYDGFLDHPFGIGGGNEPSFFNHQGSYYLESHNTFISALLESGILGLICLLAFCLLIFISLLRLKSSHYKFLGLFIFFYIIIQMGKGSMLDSKLLWLPLSMCILIVENQFLIRRGHGSANRVEVI